MPALPLVTTALAAVAACSSSSPNAATTSTSGSSSSGATTTSSGAASTSSSSSSSSSGAPFTPGPVASHSSSIAVSPDGKTIYVVNADSDSFSILDATTGTLTSEIALGSGPPKSDATGHYTPSVLPRALALSPGRRLLYISGERSSAVHVYDLAAKTLRAPIPVGSEPVGLVVSADESSVYVACSNQGTVVKIDEASGKVVATGNLTDGTSPLGYTIPAQPWALAWSADQSELYATHLISPYVSAIDPTTLATKSLINIPDVAGRGNKVLANGQARALYDVAPRPGGSGEMWVAHLMLATGTPQTNDSTTLDFESTAFPTVSVLMNDAYSTRMTTNAASVPGINGAFGDVVSGPHAMTFTADGAFALVLNSASEDILAIDANGKVEATLLHPLYMTGGNPGHMQEGIVLSPDGTHAYVDERNTADVAVIDVAETNTAGATSISLNVTQSPIARFASADPMPANLREGQLMFNTANSDLYPITQNHWIACATCHVEGRSDAVTWKFLPGPRDTPTNAGGKSDTGFELRTADRREVTDYWQTVNREQGGDFGGSTNDAGVTTPPDPLENATTIAFMQSIADYVNYAIPLPIPPQQDAALVAQGQAIFNSATAACTACHTGAAYTNSCMGAGLGTDAGCDLALASMTLIDATDAGIDTCNTSSFPDVDHTDEDGNFRAACKFNVPSLRGLASTPPYLHDGSAATLYDLLAITKGHMGNTTQLTPAEIDALVAFLRSL